MDIKEILQEIKEDIIKYDFDYIEYNYNNNRWEKTFIIDGDDVIYYYRDDMGYFTGKIDKNRFKILDNKSIITILASDYYYNYVYDEEGV